jgi:hypothetical protein
MSIEKPTPEEIKAKDKLMKAEKRKLNVMLEDLEKEKLGAAKGLVDECAFMRATLKQYREYINAEGLIDIMPQGNYDVKREHPAMRSYCTLTQKYSVCLKQLIDLLRDKPSKPESDDFDDFRKRKLASQDGDGT